MLRTMLGRGWRHKLRDYLPLLLDRLQSAGDDARRVDGAGLMECRVAER
jgi:hypothetical protein